MEKIYKVYRIDHRIEGELQAVYIGYTSRSLKDRLIHHLRDSKCRFGQYWLAYTSGEHLSHRDELTITELASTDIKVDAIALEEEQTEIAIKIYGNKCLNDRVGYKFSDEYRMKRRGSNNPMFGKTHTEETKKKLSEANKGKKRSEEAKKKTSEALRGSNNPKAQSCEYDGITFGCMKDAYEYAQSRGYTKTYWTFKQMIKKEQHSS